MNWYKRAKEIFKDDEFSKSKWKFVDSSFIEAISYYSPLRILEVKMKNGRIYAFSDVPKKTFENFMNASSKGNFFNEVIRKRYTLKILKKIKGNLEGKIE